MVAQTSSSKKDNLYDADVVPKSLDDNAAEEKKTVTLQDAVLQMEKLYTEKEEEVKTAQESATRAQLLLCQKEREALQILRQLTPLQNRFLLNAIEIQKKTIEDLSNAAKNI